MDSLFFKLLNLLHDLVGCYRTPDYSPIIDNFPITLPNPEDVKLVREDLKALAAEYPDLRSVVYDQTFLDYWAKQYGGRVAFEQLKKQIDGFSFTDNLIQLTAITQTKDAKQPTYWDIQASNMDGSIATAYVVLSNNHTLHVDVIKNPITAKIYRQQAILKEMTAVLIARKLYYALGVTQNDKNEHGQSLTTAMTENVSVAISLDFMRIHANEIPPEDQEIYKKIMDDLREYSKKTNVLMIQR